MKVLQDRLAAMNLKMTDLRNQMQSVKQELRMAQKVFQSQAPSLLVGPGLGSERGVAGTTGSIQDQRVLSPMSTVLLPLGQAPDPVTSFQQLLKQTHVVSGVAGCLRDPAYLPSRCPPQPWTEGDSAVLPGRVLEPSSCCVHQGRSWVFPSQATLDLGACQDPPPTLRCL